MTITLKSKYGLYDYSELEGNGIKPDESVMVINFKDLTQATFSSDWEIIF